MTNEHGQEGNAYIDPATALNRMHGKKDLYLKMLKLFMQSEEFSTLEDCLGAGDFERAAEHAHAIKGMAGNLSLHKLTDAVTRLMGELRAQSPQEETLAAYRDTLEKTRESINEFSQ